MKPNGFPKEEKLKNKTDISLLFEQGKWFSYKELAIISLQKEDLSVQKVGVSVSKKFFQNSFHFFLSNSLIQKLKKLWQLK